jgi:C4-dicarboxylate transporter DctM subunit
MVLAIPLEPIPVMLLFVPVLLPVMISLGVNPVHFGVVMVLSLSIAFVLPPAGLVMFIMCSIAQCSVMQFTRAIWPFLIVLLVVLALVTYCPPLTLFVPNMLLPTHGAG